MNEHIVITAEQYDRVDGRNAYHSATKRLTLGAPMQEQNRSMPIAAQVWQEGPDGTLQVHAELPIHQVLDLMLLVSRTLLHFQSAYRMPLLYDPENPTIERVGVQGGVLPVAVCTANQQINDDMQAFAQALGDLGELTGERLRTLTRILKEAEYG